MKKKSYLLVSILLLGLLGIAIYFQHSSAQRTDPFSQESVARLQEVGDTTPNKAESKQAQIGRNGRRGAYSFPQRAHVGSDNALAVIRELTPRAQAGDAEAALTLYLKLNACKDPTSSDSLAPDMMEMNEKLGISNETIIQRAAKKAEDCLGVTQAHKERGKWLEQAAKAGHPEAQLLYASDVEGVLGDSDDMLRDPEKVKQYKIDASRYLNDLAAGGNVDAMLLLATDFDNGIMAKQDSVRAYAYYRAAQMAAPSDIPASLLQFKKEKVPAGSRAEADRLAEQIYERCCGKQ